MDNNSTKKSQLAYDKKELVKTYMKSNYRIVGPLKHSAIKPCHWMTEKLLTGRENRNCYKGYFGIESETCLQNTPALPFCNHQCVFCWRDIENASYGSEWRGPADAPKKIVDEMIRHSKNLIAEHITLKKSLDNFDLMHKVLGIFLQEQTKNPLKRELGFTISQLAKKLKTTKTKTHRATLLLKNCDILENPEEKDYRMRNSVRESLKTPQDIKDLIEKKVTTKHEIVTAFEKAKNPKHAAISLAGEPTLYPYIGELVQEFRSRKMCTFIVTNGTSPEKIQQMEREGKLPTQLYVTLPASNRTEFAKICRPLIRDSWDRLNETLSLLPTLSCRTVVRITAVKYLNISDEMVGQYAEILTRSPPNFVDIKGFTVEAHALELEKRLGKLKGDHHLRDFAPSNRDLEHFARLLSAKTNFEIIEINTTSKDILLRANWPKEKPITIDFDHV